MIWDYMTFMWRHRNSMDVLEKKEMAFKQSEAGTRMFDVKPNFWTKINGLISLLGMWWGEQKEWELSQSVLLEDTKVEK